MPFKTITKDDVLVIQCPADIEEVDVKLFKIQTKSWVANAAKTICLDFTLTESILQPFLRDVVQFEKELQTSGKKLFSIGLQPKTQKLIEDSGLMRVFNAK
jgi:anti-anti-sigma regulatory factor